MSIVSHPANKAYLDNWSATFGKKPKLEEKKCGVCEHAAHDGKECTHMMFFESADGVCACPSR